MQPTLSSKTEKWERIGKAHSLVTAKFFHLHVTIVLYTSATVIGRHEEMQRK
jgi:hypothetical protein